MRDPDAYSPTNSRCQHCSVMRSWTRDLLSPEACCSTRPQSSASSSFTQAITTRRGSEWCWRSVAWSPFPLGNILPAFYPFLLKILWKAVMFLSIADIYFSHDATTYWQLGEVRRAGVCVNVNANTRDGAADILIVSGSSCSQWALGNLSDTIYPKFCSTRNTQMYCMSFLCPVSCKSVTVMWRFPLWIQYWGMQLH